MPPIAASPTTTRIAVRIFFLSFDFGGRFISILLRNYWRAVQALLRERRFYAKFDAPNHQLRADIQFSRSLRDSRAVPALQNTRHYTVSFGKSLILGQFLLARRNGLGIQGRLRSQNWFAYGTFESHFRNRRFD